MQQATSLTFSGYRLKTALGNFLLPYNVAQPVECCPLLLTFPARTVIGIVATVVISNVVKKYAGISLSLRDC